MLLQNSLDEYLKSLKKKPDRLEAIRIAKRIAQLSKPKQRTEEDDEDLIGPGSYEPVDKYLSTKSKTPTMKIGKSLRFKDLKIPPIKNLFSKDNCLPSDRSKSSNKIDLSTPSFTFNRTGHNLKLVENPDFPGVGRYSPIKDMNFKAYSFNKSKREFNWKLCNKSLIKRAEFDRKFLKSVND